MKVNNSRNLCGAQYYGIKIFFEEKLTPLLMMLLGCVLIKDIKTPCHYSLKALQIYQNHLRLSFYIRNTIA